MNIPRCHSDPGDGLINALLSIMQTTRSRCPGFDDKITSCWRWPRRTWAATNDSLASSADTLDTRPYASRVRRCFDLSIASCLSINYLVSLLLLLVPSLLSGVRSSDNGYYECQLSSYPPQSIFVELKVTGKNASSSFPVNFDLFFLFFWEYPY